MSSQRAVFERRLRNIAYVAVVIGAWHRVPCAGYGEESASSREQFETAKVYLAGMWKMRERLVSGEFEAIEHKLRPGTSPGLKVMRGKVACSFDVANDGFRLDSYY